MKFIIGFVVVVACVLGGYVLADGHLDVLWQPLEFLIIFGAGIGAFVINNPGSILKGTLGSLGKLIKGPAYNNESYLELLSCMYAIFKLAKSKGDLALESHIENPHESSLFNQFPGLAADHHALEFTCDYLRLLTLGTSNAMEVENIMDQELEGHHNEKHAISAAVLGLGDALPALGIVAAVLGIIHTMGSITEPPEILGHLIGAALVGTFSGILFSYGFVSPMVHRWAIRSMKKAAISSPSRPASSPICRATPRRCRSNSPVKSCHHIYDPVLKILKKRSKTSAMSSNP